MDVYLYCSLDSRDNGYRSFDAYRDDCVGVSHGGGGQVSFYICTVNIIYGRNFMS